MKDSTIADLDDLHNKAKRARNKLEPVWYLNLAFYYGEQWVAWDGNGLYRPRLRPNRITIVDNRIQPCVRVEIAKMTKNRPVFTVSPRTSDPEDANAAALGEQLMRYLWKHLTLGELTAKALHWSRITGAGFLKVFWDPSIGDGCDCVVGPDNQVLTGANGSPLDPRQVDAGALSASLGVPVQVKRVSQGDIRVEVRSPFQVFPDPLADTFDECEWLIEESVKSVESCERKYGVTLEADTTSNPGLIESRMGAVFLPGTTAYKGVKLREYWCKPNREHPNGRHMVWSKNGVLLQNDNPFDSFPYVMLSGIPMPGRLWPTSVVEQLRGPQMELNKVKSQIAENRNRVGNPTILASKQAVQDPEKFADSTTMPGGIYFFDDLGSPNSVPTYLVAPPLPQYVVDEVQRIEESIQEISGQHDVSSSNVPPGVTAASAINLLMEADDTRLGPAISDFERQLEKLGQKILKLAGRFYTDERTVRIAGDEGQWEIFPFRSSMLRDNTHLEVQAGSAFPQSKAAKQAAMQDLLTFFVQSGNPPHGKELAQFLKDWEVGGAEKLVEDYTIDWSQAERENAKMRQGIVCEVNADLDDHQAHIDCHGNCEKSQAFEMWPPDAKQMHQAHLAVHRQALAQQQAAQMQVEQQANGQAPPGLQEAQGAQDLAGQQMQQGQQAAAAGQDMNIKSAQAQHQNEMTLAQEQQARRHAEEQHQQRMRHAEEAHQARMEHESQRARAQRAQGQKGPQSK